MIEPFNTRYLLPTKEFRCLSLLLAIHEEPSSSQKTIGEATHLSSSMVNNYIKQFNKDGLIKISGETNRTVSYHVTEAGYEMMASSLLEYSAEIVQLYSAVKKEMIRILNGFYAEGIKRIVLYGAAETAEIVYSAIRQTRLRVTGVIDWDSRKHGSRFNDHVIEPPEKLNQLNFDAVLIASFGRQEEIYSYLKNLSGGKIVIKRLSDL